jgi:arginyl-tRNA synthetase
MSSMSRPIRPAHCMWAIAGARCLAMRWQHCSAATGYDVTKEYYINDAGAQVDTCSARSAFLRYREALGETIGEIPAGLYPGDYLKAVGQALAAEHGTKLGPCRKRMAGTGRRAKAIAMMMDLIREDLAALNIRQEVFFSEKVAAHVRCRG